MKQPDPMDRVSPMLEPTRTPVMYQDWCHLAFLHWKVPPEKLQAMLPPGLMIDTFDGNAYVAITPFTVRGARPVLVPPVPLLSNFHETNVRTYVHDNGRNPGVWFFSLDASNPVAVVAAQTFYRLPYQHARMQMTFVDEKIPIVDYSMQRQGAEETPANLTVRYQPLSPPSPSKEGSLEFFLTERYFLYAHHNGKLLRAQVHHQPWPLQKAEVSGLDETLLWAAGIHKTEDPPLAHYAREVNVKVYAIEPVE